MELDLQSLFGLLCSNTYWLRPRISPPPPAPHLGSYTRALLVSRDRRHLFVTPSPLSLNRTCKCCRPKKKKKASQENGGGEGQSAAAFQPNEVEIIFKPHASLTPELGKKINSYIVGK